MKQPITFELWNDKKTGKKKRVIIIRSPTGKFQSRIDQKGSGIKTKEQAYKKYKKDHTLQKDTVRISKRNTRTESKKAKAIILKGKDKIKKVDVSKSGFQSATQIGSNTTVISSKKRIPNQKHSQVVATVKWNKSADQETFGFSTLIGSSKEAFAKEDGPNAEAFNKARVQAITKQYITYNHQFHFESDKKGYAYLIKDKDSDTRSEEIPFTVEYTYKTYINSTLKTFESQENRK